MLRLILESGVHKFCDALFGIFGTLYPLDIDHSTQIVPFRQNLVSSCKEQIIMNIQNLVLNYLLTNK